MPTHVVTAITYGGRAHLVFREVQNSKLKHVNLIDVIQDRYINYDNLSIDAFLKADVDLKQYRLEISARFNLTYKDFEQQLNNVTDIKV